jgi:hypothetical protein
MILYHFTSHLHMDAIAREGLTKGDVPTSLTRGVNGVWFTTSSEPCGHGLPERVRDFTSEESEVIFRIYGIRIKGVKAAGKHDVRIGVVIPSTDRALVTWSRWGRKHCEPGFFQALNECGPAWRTWFIYFGTILPARFRSVEILRPLASAVAA